MQCKLELICAILEFGKLPIAVFDIDSFDGLLFLSRPLDRISVLGGRGRKIMNTQLYCSQLEVPSRIENQTSVLLIEDDSLDAEFVQRTLKSAGSRYCITWARSLKEAIQYTKAQDFDLLLTDLSLPDSMGNETLERLRVAVPQVAIVVLTSSNDLELAERLMRSGAQDFIPKETLSRDVLDRAIRHAIQRHSNILETKALLREISAARELLTAKNKKLELLNRQAHDFVDNVSHEFRTPLTVIKEYTSLIREGFVGSVSYEQGRMLGIVENRVDDLNTMVDDMLDSSRLEAGLMEARRKPCTVAEILEHVTAAMELKAHIKGVHLRWIVSDNLPTLYCDAEKIGRVLINLGVNALKFCGTPGEVRIVIGRQNSDPEIVVSVEDNGPGIDPVNLQEIFERFRQLGTAAHTSCKGFGLGLAIAKELVELNFGALTVSSEEGYGSKFQFTVPTNEPLSIMRRYLATIRNSPACPPMATLLLAKADTHGCHDTLVELEEFLHSVYRCNDLLFRGPEQDFLLVLLTDEVELSPFLERAQQSWESTNRNRRKSPLPIIEYVSLGTWRLDECPQVLLQRVEQHILKGQHSCA